MSEPADAATRRCRRRCRAAAALIGCGGDPDDGGTTATTQTSSSGSTGTTTVPRPQASRRRPPAATTTPDAAEEATEDTEDYSIGKLVRDDSLPYPYQFPEPNKQPVPGGRMQVAATYRVQNFDPTTSAAGVRSRRYNGAGRERDAPRLHVDLPDRRGREVRLRPLRPGGCAPVLLAQPAPPRRRTTPPSRSDGDRHGGLHPAAPALPDDLPARDRGRGQHRHGRGRHGPDDPHRGRDGSHLAFDKKTTGSALPARRAPGTSRPASRPSAQLDRVLRRGDPRGPREAARDTPTGSSSTAVSRSA